MGSRAYSCKDCLRSHGGHPGDSPTRAGGEGILSCTPTPPHLSPPPNPLAMTHASGFCGAGAPRQRREGWGPEGAIVHLLGTMPPGCVRTGRRMGAGGAPTVSATGLTDTGDGNHGPFLSEMSVTLDAWTGRYPSPFRRPLPGGQPRENQALKMGRPHHPA